MGLLLAVTTSAPRCDDHQPRRDHARRLVLFGVGLATWRVTSSRRT
jgi:hypothetical protein